MSQSDYTEHIARISYGKDSLKMLDVIISRGLPLDRITTTDVWATDTVPAWLPPMQQFRERMDERIWWKYRMEVEHLCARNKDGSKRTYEKMFYHVPVRRSQTCKVERRARPGSILGFPDLWNPWCQAGLKRSARTPSAGNDYRIPSQHRIQLLPETQNLWAQQSRDSHYPGGETEASGVRISRHRQHGVFCRAPHEARENKYRGILRNCSGRACPVWPTG